MNINDESLEEAWRERINNEPMDLFKTLTALGLPNTGEILLEKEVPGQVLPLSIKTVGDVALLKYLIDNFLVHKEGYAQVWTPGEGWTAGGTIDLPDSDSDDARDAYVEAFIDHGPNNDAEMYYLNTGTFIVSVHQAPHAYGVFPEFTDSRQVMEYLLERSGVSKVDIDRALSYLLADHHCLFPCLLRAKYSGEDVLLDKHPTYVCALTFGDLLFEERDQAGQQYRYLETWNILLKKLGYRGEELLLPNIPTCIWKKFLEETRRAGKEELEVLTSTLPPSFETVEENLETPSHKIAEVNIDLSSIELRTLANMATLLQTPGEDRDNMVTILSALTGTKIDIEVIKEKYDE